LYFSLYNGKIIAALRNLGVDDLFQKGISDICIHNKKIAGSSIYRTKDALLFHSVLNVSEPVITIEKYLKYPAREPDYRESRPHRDFVTSLHHEGYRLEAGQIKSAIRKEF
jgi:lipoate-protein ligase A